MALDFDCERMRFLPRSIIGTSAALAATTAVGVGAISMVPLTGAPAHAQATPSLMEFRWDDNKDYRKLYFFMTDTVRRNRSDYFLILRPKDRKTAILKLSVSIPESFDTKLDPKRVKLCKMSEGGMLKRTRCEETIPATIEAFEDGGGIDIYPDTPVSDQETIGVYMRLFNPMSAGMYQFNAMAQAPGQLPISGYLGSWLIQIDPN